MEESQTDWTVADVARRVANIYLRYEYFDRTLSLLRKAYEYYRTSFGENHQSCAIVLMEMAKLALQLSRPKGALVYLKRADAIIQKLPTVHNDLTTTSATLHEQCLAKLGPRHHRR